MPHSAAALAQVMHLSMSAKKDFKELHDLGGLLRLSLDAAPAQSLRVPTAIMEAIPGMSGLWWMQLPCAYPEAPTCTRLLVGGLAGAICPLAQVPHRVRLHLMEGALLWWQESYGHDERGERLYKHYGKNESWEIIENEPHGFVAATDFLAYNVFSPFFTD